jgi:hypothetical protein
MKRTPSSLGRCIVQLAIPLSLLALLGCDLIKNISPDEKTKVLVAPEITSAGISR